MKIKLELLEIVHLQNICRKPQQWRHYIVEVMTLWDAGLVWFSENESSVQLVRPTDLGRKVLKQHLPFIAQEETDLNKPLGLNAHYYL